MTLQELLESPLMQRAKVVAGSAGMSREVTWCVVDSVLSFDNYIMPGLLVLTSRKHLGLDVKTYVDTLVRIQAAGMVVFSDNDSFLEGTAQDLFDANDIPLICAPKSSGTLTFMKHFASVYSTYYLDDFRRDEWIREVCFGSAITGDEALARINGYNPDCAYCCLSMVMRDKEGYDSVVREMSTTKMRNHLNEHLALPDAPVLSFVENDDVVAFVPWNESDTIRYLRERIERTISVPGRPITVCKWNSAVGSLARTVPDFHESYMRALRTRGVTTMLGVHNKVNFYDDWYMHMLLLKEQRSELREHMEHTLAPILDSPDLLDTLITYLVYGENLKLTAEKMYIHVNTLKYRLHKISELLGVDLKDPNIRFRLRMAVTIERYLRTEDELDSGNRKDLLSSTPE